MAYMVTAAVISHTQIAIAPGVIASQVILSELRVRLKHATFTEVVLYQRPDVS